MGVKECQIRTVLARHHRQKKSRPIRNGPGSRLGAFQSSAEANGEERRQTDLLARAITFDSVDPDGVRTPGAEETVTRETIVAGAVWIAEAAAEITADTHTRIRRRVAELALRARKRIVLATRGTGHTSLALTGHRIAGRA